MSAETAIIVVVSVAVALAIDACLTHDVIGKFRSWRRERARAECLERHRRHLEDMQRWYSARGYVVHARSCRRDLDAMSFEQSIATSRAKMTSLATEVGGQMAAGIRASLAELAEIEPPPEP